ncbi:MAG TPA: hypothetical protein VGQ51_00150 [Puia sp.]|jgi:hypothetical protein|nr:hypothetical protein [Puia sp.]
MYGHYLILLSLVIVSCRKENTPASADDASSSNKKATTGLVQGPPPIVWWSDGPTIPYADDIPGDVPRNNEYGQGFSINGKGYVCGSLLTTGWNTGDYIGDLWEFDPATESWTEKSPCPLAGGQLIEAANFVIGDNAYIVIGNATYQYNQPTDTWTQKAYIFSVPRALATAFTINDKGYIGLGYDQSSSQVSEQNDWWEYDPVADRWTQKAAFPGAKREGAAGFAVNGKGYVIGGSHFANGHGNWGSKVWQYDPVTDAWSQKSDFPGAGRYEAVAATGTIGGVELGLLVGGGNANTLFTDAWEYNSATDNWGQFANMPGGGRYVPAGFVVGHSLCITNKTMVSLNWSR